MNKNWKRIWMTLLPLSILLVCMVACESGTDPSQPPPGLEQSGLEQSGLDQPVDEPARVNLTDTVQPDDNTVSFDTALLDEETIRLNNETRLERQRSLPAVGELYFEVLTDFPVAAGEEIIVELRVRGVDDMFGCGFEVGFNDELLDVVDVDLTGCMLGDDLVYLTQVIIPGELPIGITRKRSEEGLTGISGDWLLATVTYATKILINDPQSLNLSPLTVETIPRYTTAGLIEFRFILSSNDAINSENTMEQGDV